MGYILNVDLETSEGPSHEVYVRIESLTFNKVTSKIMLQLTYWIDQDHAKRFNRDYIEEEAKNAIGLIQERVLYFKDESSDGEEVILPHYCESTITVEKEIEIPVYETKTVKQEVPYTSFDDNGDEITLFRTVSAEEQIKTGTKKEVKNVIDPNILGNIYEFSYGFAKEKLKEWFPLNKIETK